MIEFGGVEYNVNSAKQERPGLWMDTLAQDLRYGLRALNPMATTIAIAATAQGNARRHGG